MIKPSFDICFPKFTTEKKTIIPEYGLNIIYGESGVGKTQLCRIFAGVYSRNEITNFQLEFLNWSNKRMLVFQNPDDQIISPTIYKEFAFNFENLGYSSGLIQNKINQLCDQFQLKWDLKRHPATLSGGEKQILNIVTALSTDPKILIIDDGLGYLSEENKLKIVRHIQEYCKINNSIAIWVTSDITDLHFVEQGWELKLDSFVERRSGVFGRNSADVEPTADGMATVKFENVSFAYPGTKHLFKDLSLSLGKFRSLAILGDNGSGKSTIGNLITKILHPSAGKIKLVIANKDIPQIGYLPQFPERFAGGHTFNEITDKMLTNGLLTQTNLILLKNALLEYQIMWDMVKNKPIHNLRLSIARIVFLTLVCYGTYDLIILDEPTFSLGRKLQTALIRFMRDILNRKHFIIISHNDTFTRNICDREIKIENNQIVQIDKNRAEYV